MKQRNLIILAVTAVVLTSTLLLYSSKNNQLNNRTDSVEKDLKPQLSSIDYSVVNIDDDSVEINSENYGFSIEVPSFFERSKTGAFDPKFPENETVSIGAHDPENNSGITMSLSIGMLQDKTLDMLITEHIKNAKLSFDPSRNVENITDGEIDLKREQIEIGNEKTVKVRHVGAFGQESIQYYLQNSDNYFRIFFGRIDGKKFTSDQIKEINMIVNTFRFI